MLNKIRSWLIFAFFLVFGCHENTNNRTSSDVTTKSDSLAFGDTKFLSQGLEGKIYLIAEGSSLIPLFDTMRSVNTIYTDSINVPERNWSQGFPGLPERFEWFGIEYKGNFKPRQKGKYIFRLVSDDGSKLFIDDSLLIDNDGLHAVASKAGEIDLDASQHNIKIQYIQGPRWSIALQLFANLDKEEEQTFPGKYFQITELRENFWSSKKSYFVIGILLLIILWIVYQTAKRKSKRKTDKIGNA